jgi:hypothetical protein
MIHFASSVRGKPKCIALGVTDASNGARRIISVSHCFEANHGERKVGWHSASVEMDLESDSSACWIRVPVAA